MPVWRWALAAGTWSPGALRVRAPSRLCPHLGRSRLGSRAPGGWSEDARRVAGRHGGTSSSLPTPRLHRGRMRSVFTGLWASSGGVFHQFIKIFLNDHFINLECLWHCLAIEYLWHVEIRFTYLYVRTHKGILFIYFLRIVLYIIIISNISINKSKISIIPLHIICKYYPGLAEWNNRILCITLTLSCPYNILLSVSSLEAIKISSLADKRLKSVGSEFDKRLYWGNWPYRASRPNSGDKAESWILHTSNSHLQYLFRGYFYSQLWRQTENQAAHRNTLRFILNLFSYQSYINW